MQVRSLQLIRIAFCLMFTAGVSFAAGCDGGSDDGNSDVKNSEREESGSGASGGKRAPADSSKGGKGGEAAPKPAGGAGGKTSDPSKGGSGGEKASMSNGGKGGSAAAGKGGAGGKAGSSAATGGKGGAGGAGGNGAVAAYDPAACEACMKRHPACEMVWDGCENVPGTANKGSGAGMARSALCKAVVDCVRRTRCAGSEEGSGFNRCYCGSQADCDQTAEAFGKADGPCKNEIFAATESTSLADFTQQIPDPNFGGGAAAIVIGVCDGAFCGATCPGACEEGSKRPECQAAQECQDPDSPMLPAICAKPGDGAGGMSGGAGGSSGGEAAGSGGASGSGGSAAGSGGQE